MLRLFDIIHLVFLLLGISRGEAGVNVLWNRNMLFTLPQFPTRDICCFQRTVFVKSTADEISAIR
jgi:hypothetical protein